MWGVSVPQKICIGEKDGDENLEMIRLFIKYIFKSKSMKKYSKFVPSDDLFEVPTVIINLIEHKKIDSHNLVLIENVGRCLETVRIIAVVYNSMEAMRHQNFDIFNEDHVKMLESLWILLKETPRQVEGLVSNEWTELGFQGNDPTTDFRSMGMLGLYQLHFFAKRKTDIAKLILQEFNTSERKFPFAIIGINLTRLIIEMLTQRRLHNRIIDLFGNITVNSGLAYLEGPSNDQDCIDYCIGIVHEVYCQAFEEFYLVWVVRKPTSIMAFTELYEEVQAIMHQKFPPII